MRRKSAFLTCGAIIIIIIVSLPCRFSSCAFSATEIQICVDLFEPEVS
jgi:hypothetical protein